ncbi:hypothetical protein M8C21_032443, partial [Ambrosia artemisiifolia]
VYKVKKNSKIYENLISPIELNRNKSTNSNQKSIWKWNLFEHICRGFESRSLQIEFIYRNAASKSEGGLFVDMNTFLAFGKDYVRWNFEKTGNPVYLHIKQTKKPIPQDRPLKKPTLTIIGFDNQEHEYDETYSI